MVLLDIKIDGFLDPCQNIYVAEFKGCTFLLGHCSAGETSVQQGIPIFFYRQILYKDLTHVMFHVLFIELMELYCHNQAERNGYVECEHLDQKESETGNSRSEDIGERS